MEPINSLMSSSRGGGIADKMWEGFHLTPFVQSSATFGMIEQTAKEKLPGLVWNSDDVHAYVLAGIPDITWLVKNKNTHYRECIYIGNPSHTLNNIRENIHSLTNTMEEKGAHAIFCTITPMNITIYNKSLRTSTRRYTDQYDFMQTQIDHIIKEANIFIQNHNTNRGFATPMLHFAIVRRHGKGRRGYYKYHWEGLKDGLHATPKTRAKWANSIRTAITKNRGTTPTQTRTAPTEIATTLTYSSDDEPQPPKRHWKSERTDFTTSYNQH